MCIVTIQYLKSNCFNVMPVVPGDDLNKQTRNKTSRGVSQQVRLGTILWVGKTRKPRKAKGDG